jgi:hypothetical protein
MVAGYTIENDGTTWKLVLRDGLVFHDGAKVLARDCVASIRRWGARDLFGQTLTQRTDELTAPDDRTIVFRLNKLCAIGGSMHPMSLRNERSLPRSRSRPSSMCRIFPSAPGTPNRFDRSSGRAGNLLELRRQG